MYNRWKTIVFSKQFSYSTRLLFVFTKIVVFTEIRIVFTQSEKWFSIVDKSSMGLHCF